ncbi:transcription factor TGA7 [Pyrus x bretschneideri]|uniref:transcription factor TGA7 n=1 Tax=Pyrus x bretschneideri TaxID=225117 RepID=UPI00202F16E2|nr:transcription factor TGA7 [Pyrus x bretschneideri]XP_048438893.1 transcription factor TGA7 [Pyrus x bretschneideri]XP_048438894.1 transcription factor TGA7 [Pyrus x bretschneideri]XP_048438895.1 transcription factor TGA7 [Pyrus x bretschneideri]XP_048438896.1 transcription factor TGA7 [Pyrus x bretschneideri]
MSYSSTQFATSRQMGIYEPFRQIGVWKETFRGDHTSNTAASTILEEDSGIENKIGFVSHEPMLPSGNGNDHEPSRSADKVQRRLEQNREAARKSRMRKKAYVQQLETSRLKLAQLELEIDRVRKRGAYASSSLGTSHMGYNGALNSEITTFEMEYVHWVEEQHRQIVELKNALRDHATDIELRKLVDSGLNHYAILFRMKADAARADIFYLLSGIWRTPVERHFHWIGGFRPSELLNIVLPQLQPLTDQQLLDFYNLQQSSQQAEDALSQGMDKLQQTLALSIAADQMSEGIGCQMTSALEKLEALESFVSQADHLRQQTLQQMSRILTTHQAAEGLLALGEYFHRLRALSSLWTTRPRKPT